MEITGQISNLFYRSNTKLIGFSFIYYDRPLLKQIKNSAEAHIVLDCSTEKIYDVLKQAQQIGMMSDYHSYLITSLVNVNRIRLIFRNYSLLFDSFRTCTVLIWMSSNMGGRILPLFVWWIQMISMSSKPFTIGPWWKRDRARRTTIPLARSWPHWKIPRSLRPKRLWCMMQYTCLPKLYMI